MRILHLSDLHFGSKANANNWYSQLADDLVSELSCKTVEFLVLSGDIANKATPGEYSAAASFLVALTKEFKIDKTKIIIVPGNHDVNWGQAKKSYRPTRREGNKWPQDEEGKPDSDYAIDKDEYVEVVNPDAYKRRFDNFRHFYGLITGCEYPSDYQNQGLLYSFPESGLLFLGLNSAWQLDHHYTARASINPDALSNALTQLRGGAESLSETIKIAVWHHPLNSRAEDRLANQDFLQRLALAGFSLGMHGHIHKSEASLYCYDMSAGGRRLNIVTAGTFGAPVRQWLPGYPLQYNLITLTDEKLIVDTRCRRELNGAWTPDAIWLQGSGHDPLPRYELPLPVRRKLSVLAQSERAKPYELEEKETPGFNPGQNKEKILIPDNADAGHPSEIETKTILIVAANPSDTSPLRLAKEVREICDVLRYATQRKFHVEVRWAVRIRDLRQALLEVEPHIVHFSGHGGREGIVLEDDEGRSALLSPEALADLFRLLEGGPECFVECVFLNACFTEIQSSAIKPFVEYVVGIGNLAEDNTAIEFARGFYEALSLGRNYEQAYQFGCSAVRFRDSFGAAIMPVMQKNEIHRNVTQPRTRTPRGNLSLARRTILLLSSEPTGFPRVRWDEEYREINAELRPAMVRGDIKLESRGGVRLEDVYFALHDIQPQIVHFTGFGNAGGLFFENSSGGAELVRVEDLKELFELTRVKYECIVLNTDLSEGCAKILIDYAEYTIGVVERATERNSILFSKGFYRGLAASRSIEDSYRTGKLEVRVRDRPAAEMYRLYSRAGNEIK